MRQGVFLQISITKQPRFPGVVDSGSFYTRWRTHPLPKTIKTGFMGNLRSEESW